MSKVKEALDTILNCEDCYGNGAIFYGNGEEYDFEWCDCNPNHIILEYGKVVA